MAAGIVLEARSLTKRFGGVTAVDAMSLSVARGEILGLIGPNGAGKTTMFDLLAGSVSVSSGTIQLMGRDITTEPAYRRLAGGMGRTFQIPRPFPELTLLENMLIARQHQTGERLWANFIAPRRIAAEERAAREKAREWFDLWPKAAYWTEVESWRMLEGDRIEFTMRRLPSAD